MVMLGIDGTSQSAMFAVMLAAGAGAALLALRKKRS